MLSTCVKDLAQPAKQELKTKTDEQTADTADIIIHLNWIDGFYFALHFPREKFMRNPQLRFQLKCGSIVQISTELLRFERNQLEMLQITWAENAIEKTKPQVYPQSHTSRYFRTLLHHELVSP